jgi:hypothetical protein
LQECAAWNFRSSLSGCPSAAADAIDVHALVVPSQRKDDVRRASRLPRALLGLALAVPDARGTPMCVAVTCLEDEFACIVYAPQTLRDATNTCMDINSALRVHIYGP